MWHSRPPRDPPPFMANAILNFHFDYPHTSLTDRFENLQTTVFVKTFEWQISLFNYVKQTKITCDASKISICKTNMVNEVSYSLAKSTVTYDVHRQKDSEFHAVS